MGAGTSFRVPLPPIHLLPLHATICAETVARWEWRTSSHSCGALPLSLCTAPALRSTQGGHKGGYAPHSPFAHAHPCCVPPSHFIPLHTLLLCTNQGWGEGGHRSGFACPLCAETGQAERGGAFPCSPLFV